MHAVKANICLAVLTLINGRGGKKKILTETSLNPGFKKDPEIPFLLELCLVVVRNLKLTLLRN